VPEVGFSYLLICRRNRDFFNSNGFHWEHMRKRHAYNPASLSPAEMEALGLADGDEAEITSAHGRVRAIVKGDATLRDGVVSVVHGWGGVFGENSDPRVVGTNVNPLISDSEQVEVVNAMPRMTGIPVNIRRVNAAG
jgi:anaerobic selenocysteine-containing dehydrogenase